MQHCSAFIGTNISRVTNYPAISMPLVFTVRIKVVTACFTQLKRSKPAILSNFVIDFFAKSARIPLFYSTGYLSLNLIEMGLVQMLLLFVSINILPQTLSGS